LCAAVRVPRNWLLLHKTHKEVASGYWQPLTVIASLGGRTQPSQNMLILAQDLVGLSQLAVLMLKRRQRDGQFGGRIDSRAIMDLVLLRPPGPLAT